VRGQVGHCEVDAVGFEQPVCGDEGEACDSAEFAELGSAELKVSCGQWLCAFIDAFADSGEQDFVAAGELAGHDDGGGVENADESGDGFTDDATCIADNSDCIHLAVEDEGDDVGDGVGMDAGDGEVAL
jgi:hypothetical protein